MGFFSDVLKCRETVNGFVYIFIKQNLCKKDNGFIWFCRIKKIAFLIFWYLTHIGWVTYMHEQMRPVLVQIKVIHLFSTKPLFKAIVADWLWTTGNRPLTFELKYYSIYSQKCICKWQNDSSFVPASTYWQNVSVIQSEMHMTYSNIEYNSSVAQRQKKFCYDTIKCNAMLHTALQWQSYAADHKLTD